jgi:hypothetical protein
LYLAIFNDRKQTNIFRHLKYEVPANNENDSRRNKAVQGVLPSSRLIIEGIIVFVAALDRYGAMETTGLAFQIVHYEPFFRDLVSCIDMGDSVYGYLFTCGDGAVCGLGSVAHGVHPYLSSPNGLVTSVVFKGRDTVPLIEMISSNFIGYLLNINKQKKGRSTNNLQKIIITL